MIHTIGELKDALEDFDDDTPIVINLNRQHGITHAAIADVINASGEYTENDESGYPDAYVQIVISGVRQGYSAKQVNSLIE